LYLPDLIKLDPFRYFKISPEIIRLAVMLYVRFPLSLRNVEDLLHERGIDVSHEAVRYWWHRFGSMFAFEIRKRRIEGMCRYVRALGTLPVNSLIWDGGSIHDERRTRHSTQT
jgi:hypothetical protein